MPFPGIQTPGGALDFYVTASERGLSSRGEGLRDRAALAGDVDWQKVFLSHEQVFRCWGLDRGVWRSFMERGEFYPGERFVFWGQQPFCSQVEWTTTLVYPGQGEFLGCKTLLSNQDSPRQTRTSWSPYTFRADISAQAQLWVWQRGKEVKGDLREGGKIHIERDISAFGFSAWKGDGCKESGK